MRILALLAVLLAPTPSTLHAQTKPTGTEVRLRNAAEVIPGGGRRYTNSYLIGEAVDLRRDTLFLATEWRPEPLIMWLQDETQIETRGPVPATARGGLIGFLIGTSVGGILASLPYRGEGACTSDGLLFANNGDCDGWPYYQNESIAAGAVLGGLAGLLVGRLVGGRFSMNGWVEIDQAGLNMAVLERRSGDGKRPEVRLSLSWQAQTIEAPARSR